MTTARLCPEGLSLLLTSGCPERGTSGTPTRQNTGWKSPRTGGTREFMEISGYKANI